MTRENEDLARIIHRHKPFIPIPIAIIAIGIIGGFIAGGIPCAIIAEIVADPLTGIVVGIIGGIIGGLCGKKLFAKTLRDIIIIN